MQHELAHPDGGRCLNCGATLSGAFCAQCGQRSVPADPTVSELMGDTWQELSGYDGRIAATLRALMHPGRLTNEYLAGRRARYVTPVKLYLTVSVIYFLVAAGAPHVATRDGKVAGPGGLQVSVTQSSDKPILTEEDRAELLEDLDTAPWLLRPMLRAVAEDPEGFQARLFTIMPRVFFAMLPVFALVVALFYRGRNFPTALVFSVHLHALAFVVLALPELAKFSHSRPVSIVIAAAALITMVVYTLLSFRAVFGGSLVITVAKAAAIGVVYMVAVIPAFTIILIWASLT